MYLKILTNKLVAWVNSTFGEGGITLQKDGTTFSTANLVEEWCKRNMMRFWQKELRPPYLLF